MKKIILGLDLGTNSIGWALIKQNVVQKSGEILGMGSRIIPMSQDILGNFDKGNSVSQTAERTRYRGVRRLRERHLLRRERLHRVLNILGFLPRHYASEIDFEKRLGKFKNNTEPKLAYKKDVIFFKESFEKMVSDFRKHQPQMFYTKDNGEESSIPYNWTLFYLRNKATKEIISKEELAWIILNFNQKRGYYQLRGEEEEELQNKIKEFYSLKVVDVVADEEPNKKGEFWYSVHLENGWVYRRASKISLNDWKGKVKDFIVTTDLNEDGSVKLDKEGNEKRSFRAPSEDDWGLIKAKTEQDIRTSGKTVGTYIYDSLLKNPYQKIKGGLVTTIERKFYKEELEIILRKQIELQPELFSEELLNACAEELYKNNEVHQQYLKTRDFVHLFVEDIIFYQRPLRSQKSLIAECELEYRSYKDKKTGENKKEKLKVIPKSNPYYQEFRVLNWMHNLKVYRADENVEVTDEFFKSLEDYEDLYEFLMSQKEVDNNTVIEYLLKKSLKEKYPDAKEKAIKDELKKQMPQYHWNYVYNSEKKESKKYPMNETGYEIKNRLKKVENLPNNFLTKETEYRLWHLIYSVTDKQEYEKALYTFADNYGLDIESFVENFKKVKPYPSSYGSLSEKAIKKLLPLMRFGKYWQFSDISNDIKNKINDIIDGVYNEDIPDSIREKIVKYQLNKENDFQRLPLWLAQYIVYNRHSESGDIIKWNSVESLQEYLNNFKQHSLRNPIVEQVIVETLRVVKDIWEKYGEGKKDFFTEIHIELGREMKKTAEERSRLTNAVSENENTNLRIKSLLVEMLNDSKIKDVRPYSLTQQEKLRIYEEGVLCSGIEIADDIQKISKKAEPTKSELQRYKLWLEQKYRSPYTGEVISLSELFTSHYQREHIIPQGRFFDDSLSNKVICESEVNRLKGNQLGLEFIKKHSGEKVLINGKKEVTIFTEDEYRDFVKKHYSNNKAKREKLLMEDIPESMIARQLNDSRYISRYISHILSNIVRSEDNDDGVNSKNLVYCNGKITSRLKQDWGLNDVWNDLIYPRFERMNKITNSELFTAWSEKQQKNLPTVPLEHSKGFEKKRIDHRHHAMDALVIACATIEHINLLNNESAKSPKRYDLQKKLRKKVPYQKDGEMREKFEEFYKPWETFTQDTRKVLEEVVISFKQNLRVINKATNYYEKYVEEKGKLVKKKIKQEGVNWAIRKPLHKETVSGKIVLDREKVGKGKILTATRKSLDVTFTEKTIHSITDTGIQKILLNYLKYKEGNSELAFSPEGIEEMNKNITQFNGGKYHKPIFKVRVYEQGSKFPLGEKGAKANKYVEAAKGTNLFFGIYEKNKGGRSFETIPLNEVIERQKQGLSPVPETNDKGEKLLFTLSPNDLVYVPTEEELVENINFNKLTKEQIKRVYRVVSFTGNQCFLVQKDVATSIVNKVEFSALNKMEKSIDGVMIKEVCIKLKVDRLGNILI